MAKNLAGIGLSVLMGLLLAFGGLEFWLRWTHAELPRYAKGTFLVPYPGARTSLRPNFDAVMGSEEAPPRYRVQINSQGLRDREAGPNEEGVFRILCIGDSFTMGRGVEAEETYPKVLEALLRTRMPDRKFEVINGGCSGQGPFQELVLLKDRVELLHPDMVIQQLFSGNDLADELARVNLMPDVYDKGYLDFRKGQMNFEPFRWEYFAAQHSRAVYFLGDTFRIWRRAKLPERFLPSHALDTSGTVAPSYWAEACRKEMQPKMTKAWALVEESLAETKSYCESEGMDYFVIQFPDMFELMPVPPDEWARQYVLEDRTPYDFGLASQRFEALLQRCQIPYLCYGPVFLQKPEAERPALYIPIDRHLSVSGNGAVAENLAFMLLAAPTPRLKKFIGNAVW